MDWLGSLGSRIASFFSDRVAEPFRHFTVPDAVDILLVSLVIYVVWRFFRERRAGRVMIGLLVIVALGAVASFLRLPTLTYFIRLFGGAAFFCIVVIFQPELRDALEHIGNMNLPGLHRKVLPQTKFRRAEEVVRETVDAVFEMSRTKTGALILFEGKTKLGDYTATGKPVDAKVTSHMLRAIFFDKAPLHDGAVIIRNLRIYMASCVLPSSEGQLDFGSMGTRHRAAVGVTEVSDCLAIVVSEETGTVSVSQDGKLVRGVTPQVLTDALMIYLIGKAYLRTRHGAGVDPFAGLPTQRQLNWSTKSDLAEQNVPSVEDAPQIGKKPSAEENPAPEKKPSTAKAPSDRAKSGTKKQN